MSARILKFPVPIGGPVFIAHGAHVRHVGEQDGSVMVWAQCDDGTYDANETTWVQVVGTGWDIPPGWVFLGTVQMASGLVWHVGRVPGPLVAVPASSDAAVAS